MNGSSTSDEKTHVLQKSVIRTEKHMTALKNTLTAYVRNQERLRKKTLKLALVFKSFSEREATNLRSTLSTISEKLAEREKLREGLESRIMFGSMEPLKLYPLVCSKIQSEIKNRESALEKEFKKQQMFDKAMIKESNNKTLINQTQMELSGASQQVKNTTLALTDSIRRFESQKRQDLKTCISELIWSELQFHGKSMELLSSLYETIQSLHPESDTQEIEEKINMAASRPQSRAASPTRSFRSLSPTKLSFGFGRKNSASVDGGNGGDGKGKIDKSMISSPIVRTK